MTDLANLQIRIQSLEAAVADDRLDSLAKSGNRAEKATDGVTGAFKRFAGPAALIATTIGTLSKLTSVTREFEVLNAQLITATGSAASAGKAFEAIEDFASSTPFDLQQVTESFTKLVNLGLTPSERALVSYGDTASAMGKDLNQLIEAVADAATGEFERLKEFGIKAKSEGENVTFTFRGVKTTVKKEAAEIEEFLTKLGENNFAGAMAQRMETLDGAISNLGDEWNKLFRNISSQGLDSVLEGSVRGAINLLEELNAQLASGELVANLQAVGIAFEGMGRDIAFTVDTIVDIWNDAFSTAEGQGIAGATTETIDFITEAFANLPQNIRAAIQLLVVEIASIVDYAAEYGSAFGEVFGIELANFVERAKVYGQAIGEALNPFGEGSGIDLEAELRRLDDIAIEMTDDALKRAERNAEATTQARRDSIVAIIEERDASIKAVDDQLAASDKLRASYDEQLKARKAAAGSVDRLAEFGQGATATEEGETKKEQKQRETQEKAFESLRLSLRTEEEVIAESYRKRFDIILQNTEEGSGKQLDLKKRLDEEFATQALGALATPDTFEDQLTELEDFYNARRELILANSALTEEERTELEVELTTQRNERLRQLEQSRVSAIFSTSAELFDGLAGLAKQFAGEQSGTYKALFAVSKAFAIADSIVKIQQGIAAASSLPFPANLAAIGSTVAATAGVVSTIQGTNFAGTFDNGGTIPQGKVGLVGEFGPELISGPTNVKSRRETAEALREGGSQKEAAPVAPPVVNVRNINVLDPAIVGDYLATDEGEQMIMNVVQRNQQAIGF